jgi:hypothetical protein
MKMPDQMWTRIGVKCGLCNAEIPQRVNGMSIPSMVTQAMVLADLLAVHLVNVHHVEIPAQAPNPTREEIMEMFETAMARSRGVIAALEEK